MKHKLSQTDLIKSVRKQWDFSPTTRVHGVKGDRKFTKRDRNDWKKDI